LTILGQFYGRVIRYAADFRFKTFDFNQFARRRETVPESQKQRKPVEYQMRTLAPGIRWHITIQLNFHGYTD
jgi:hypothetical protein